jgi:glyoxylase-like metal-dependent hydrolase (beta-lactamase superfamily II)
VVRIRIETAYQPDMLLQPTQVLRVGSIYSRYIHTPDTACIIFSALQKNCILWGYDLAGSIGRPICSGGDEQTLIESIHREILRSPKPRASAIHGHGGNKQEKIINLYLRCPFIKPSHIHYTRRRNTSGSLPLFTTAACPHSGHKSYPEGD